MNVTLLSVLTLAATALATTDSQGQSVKPLTPEQASAKAAFDEGIADAVKGMKEDCGTDLAVTTDFENYNRSTYANSGGKGGDRGGRGDTGGGADKGGGDRGGGADKGGRGDTGGGGDPEQWRRDQRNPRGALRIHRSTCGEAIRALADVCAKKRSPSAKPQLPAVTGIACLMGGVQSAQEDDRTNDQVQRNMSFSNGVLTFRIPAYGAPNVRDNVFQALVPVSETTDRVNGIQCAQATDCRSGVCSKGVCTACGPRAACSGGRETCSKKGVCFHKLTPAEERAEAEEQERRDAARQDRSSDRSSGSNDSKKGAKKGLGQKCQFNSECESKICGTISSGSLHKCTSRR